MQVAIWDWVKVHERSVYKPHGALTNNIRFLPENNGNTAVTAGTDGRLKACHNRLLRCAAWARPEPVLGRLTLLGCVRSALTARRAWTRRSST